MVDCKSCIFNPTHSMVPWYQGLPHVTSWPSLIFNVPGKSFRSPSLSTSMVTTSTAISSSTSLIVPVCLLWWRWRRRRLASSPAARKCRRRERWCWKEVVGLLSTYRERGSWWPLALIAWGRRWWNKTLPKTRLTRNGDGIWHRWLLGLLIWMC